MECCEGVPTVSERYAIYLDIVRVLRDLQQLHHILNGRDATGVLSVEEGIEKVHDEPEKRPPFLSFFFLNLFLTSFVLPT